MTEINSSANNNFQNAHMSNPDAESEPRLLPQEAVDEQIKNYIALSTKQQESLTRLIQGMPWVHQVNFPPNTSTTASFSTAGTSFDSACRKAFEIDS